MIIGLEVHCELGTNQKIFCDCETIFGKQANTQCCPVCMGLPGTLPKLNKDIVDYAIRAGLSTNCKIANRSKFDRKNYFYPDLPKGYQITQYDLPLCEDGWIDIEVEQEQKRIGITRIHIEEDAGKVTYDDKGNMTIDYNRCGIGLIEIVSEPTIRSEKEAIAYLRELRSRLLFADVSDCKMQEGSFRCDVNISVRKRGTKAFGIRSEIKNLNSFTSIEGAIVYEYKRQVQELEKGNIIRQETRRYDEKSATTIVMRIKENADDYRYFAEPNLPPLDVSEEKIAQIKHEMPMLANEKRKHYIEELLLTPYDASIITMEKKLADYFDEAASNTNFPKVLANLIISEVLALTGLEALEFPIKPLHVAQIAQMQGEEVINSGVAKKVLMALWENDEDAMEYVRKNALAQISDQAVLSDMVQTVIKEEEKSVQDFQNGKTAALKALMGKVMAKSNGKANPKMVKDMLLEQLQQ